SLVRLRDDGHRSREGMIAEFSRSLLEENAAGLYWHRRQRVRLRPRWIKRTHSGLAGNAQIPLGFRVVRFEVGIGDGPIGKSRAGDCSFLAGLHEINFVKAPIVRSEVDGSSANHSAIGERRLLNSFVLRRLAKGGRLFA